MHPLQVFWKLNVSPFPLLLFFLSFYCDSFKLQPPLSPFCCQKEIVCYALYPDHITPMPATLPLPTLSYFLQLFFFFFTVLFSD